MSGDCWGIADEDAGSSEFPIYQEQQLLLSGTAGPRADICTRQRNSLLRDSEFHLMDGCSFYYVFYFSDALFYKLQSHVLPL